MTSLKKNRVLIMTEDFSIGGAQRVVSELVKNLNQEQIELRVVCIGERKYTEIERDAEEKAQVDYLCVNNKNILKRFRKIFGYLKKYNPDVIHTHLTTQLYAVPWAIFYNKAVIITAHTKPEKAFVKKIEFLIKWAVTRNKLFIVAVSMENFEQIKQYFGIDEQQCCCINNGIETNQFYRITHQNFTFINVARQDENKNQREIIRNFAKLYKENNNIRLILLGDGPCHKMLKVLVGELNLESVVSIPGAKDNVAEYYAIADVYVQASHREALPMSVLEAIAAGLPIIATDVGGLKDIVKGNGILIPDTNKLFDAMQKMLALSSNDLTKMQNESLKISKEYSSKQMACKYQTIYMKKSMR